MSNHDDCKNNNRSHIREVPGSWKQKRLKYLTKPKKELSETGEEELLSVTETRGIIKRRDLKSADEPLSRSDDLIGYRLVEEGNLVNNIMLVWKRGLGVSPYSGIVSPAYSVFSFSKECDPWYFNYLLRSEEYVTEFRRNSTGITMSRLRLYDDSFGDVFGILPPLTEQKLISRYLDKKTSQIDSLINKTEEKIKLLKEQRTSLINHYVTKGLDPKVEMKDSGVEVIGEIPKHWNRIRLKNLVSTKITDGPHETPIFVDTGIPFLSVEGVVNNKIDFNRVRGYISSETHEIYSKKCKPQKNDVLLVKSGSTTGKSTIVDTDLEFNIWSPLCILRSDTNKISPLFLFNSVQSGYFKIQIETGWSYGTQPNIGMGVIENLWITLPPINEQSEITKLLAQVTEGFDNRVQKHQKKIQLLSEYRQSLISSVVTGKVRVTEEMI